MARLPIVGQDANAWGTILNNFLSVAHNSDGTIKSGSVPVSFARSINSVSVSTAAAADASTDYVYLASGTITITLPTAVGNTNRYTVTNVGTNTITVSATGTQTINGSSSVTLPIANMSLDFVSNNANWIIE